MKRTQGKTLDFVALQNGTATKRKRLRVSLSIINTAFGSTIATSIALMEPKGVT